MAEREAMARRTSPPDWKAAWEAAESRVQELEGERDAARTFAEEFLGLSIESERKAEAAEQSLTELEAKLKDRDCLIAEIREAA